MLKPSWNSRTVLTEAPPSSLVNGDDQVDMPLPTVGHMKALARPLQRDNFSSSKKVPRAKLDPAGKRFVVTLFRMAKVAQFQPVAVVHVYWSIAAGFYQYPASTGIADIQRQIHINRIVESGGRAVCSRR